MWIAVGLVIASPAPLCAQDATTVLWLSDAPTSADEASALAVELGPRGARVRSGAAPPGDTVVVRAASARGAASAGAADAALWREREVDGSVSLRAVSPGSAMTAWAPLPLDSDPRVIALVAASLLDELLAAPPPEIPELSFRLRVSAGRRLASPIAARLVAMAPDPAPAAPEPVEAITPDEQRRELYVEVAPTFAGVAGGAGVGVGMYVHRNVRLSAHGRFTYVFLNDIFGSALSLSAAFVTDDDDGRFEAGGEAGLILTESNSSVAPGYLMTTYVGLSWGPWPDVRFGMRLNGGVAFVDQDIQPAGVLDLYLQVMP